MNPEEELQKCFESIKDKLKITPQIALILGSGLGDYADNIEIVNEIKYSDIAGFPVSTVPGHAGKFVFGYVKNIPVVCMKGRVHYYEGYPIEDVVLPIRLMHLMGAVILFLTNASGSVNETYDAGDLMLIRDHISSFVPNPLIGANIQSLGTRFPDMSEVYDRELADIIKEAAKKNQVELKEGVYTQLTGPSFESPAEIKMLRTLGTDAVGMSTVVEAITANHCHMRICGISCICNKGAGITDKHLCHEDVQEAADIIAPKFKKLVTASIEAMAQQIHTK